MALIPILAIIGIMQPDCALMMTDPWRQRLAFRALLAFLSPR
jgi:hypothetical protein